MEEVLERVRNCYPSLKVRRMWFSTKYRVISRKKKNMRGGKRVRTGISMQKNKRKKWEKWRTGSLGLRLEYLVSSDRNMSMDVEQIRTGR